MAFPRHFLLFSVVTVAFAHGSVLLDESGGLQVGALSRNAQNARRETSRQGTHVAPATPTLQGRSLLPTRGQSPAAYVDYTEFSPYVRRMAAVELRHGFQADPMAWSPFRDNMRLPDMDNARTLSGRLGLPYNNNAFRSDKEFHYKAPDYIFDNNNEFYQNADRVDIIVDERGQYDYEQPPDFVGDILIANARAGRRH